MIKKIIYSIALVTATFSSFAQDINLVPPVFCANCAAQIHRGVKWNIILTKPVKFTVPVPVYDIDGFDNSAETVAKIHAQNAKAICYINAGAWENWRSDERDFPDAIKGKSNGWSGEKWLDIRQTTQLMPIMQARINMCKDKGFDAIDFDNVDGFSNKTGFPLTAADQAKYNILLANITHQAGLAVGLKNDLDQVELLEPYFDFAVNEQCFYYKECDQMTPFINANKAVLNIEYDLKPSQFCAKAKSMYFSAIKKDLELTEEPVSFCN
ncbi:endo alpha-1,4 polygalactosaminidase [Legionella drozanskii]|nr:endo alpha-1,4 polygalactosaminidase [Legionella drozanskii]